MSLRVKNVGTTRMRGIVQLLNIERWLVFIIIEGNNAEVKINAGGVIISSVFVAKNIENAECWLGIYSD